MYIFLVGSKCSLLIPYVFHFLFSQTTTNQPVCISIVFACFFFSHSLSLSLTLSNRLFVCSFSFIAPIFPIILTNVYTQFCTRWLFVMLRAFARHPYKSFNIQTDYINLLEVSPSTYYVNFHISINVWNDIIIGFILRFRWITIHAIFSSLFSFAVYFFDFDIFFGCHRHLFKFLFGDLLRFVTTTPTLAAARLLISIRLVCVCVDVILQLQKKIPSLCYGFAPTKVAWSHTQFLFIFTFPHFFSAQFSFSWRRAKTSKDERTARGKIAFDGRT